MATGIGKDRYPDIGSDHRGLSVKHLGVMDAETHVLFAALVLIT